MKSVGRVRILTVHLEFCQNQMGLWFHIDWCISAEYSGSHYVSILHSRDFLSNVSQLIWLGISAYIDRIYAFSILYHGGHRPHLSNTDILVIYSQCII